MTKRYWETQKEKLGRLLDELREIAFNMLWLLSSVVPTVPTILIGRTSASVTFMINTVRTVSLFIFLLHSFNRLCHPRISLSLSLLVNMYNRVILFYRTKNWRTVELMKNRTYHPQLLFTNKVRYNDVVWKWYHSIERQILRLTK